MSQRRKEYLTPNNAFAHPEPCEAYWHLIGIISRHPPCYRTFNMCYPNAVQCTCRPLPWQFLLSPGRLSLQQRLTMSLCGEHPCSLSRSISSQNVMLHFRGVVKAAVNVRCRYKTLKKPSWNLPTPIFGPAW